jgi:hypothetical protein
MIERVYLTVPEVAKRLGLCISTIRNLITRGKLGALDLHTLPDVPGEFRNPTYRIHPFEIERLKSNFAPPPPTLEEEPERVLLSPIELAKLLGINRPAPAPTAYCHLSPLGRALILM